MPFQKFRSKYQRNASFQVEIYRKKWLTTRGVSLWLVGLQKFLFLVLLCWEVILTNFDWIVTKTRGPGWKRLFQTSNVVPLSIGCVVRLIYDRSVWQNGKHPTLICCIAGCKIKYHAPCTNLLGQQAQAKERGHWLPWTSSMGHGGRNWKREKIINQHKIISYVMNSALMPGRPF